MSEMREMAERPRQGAGSVGYSEVPKEKPIGEVLTTHIGFDIRRYEDEGRIVLWAVAPRSWGGSADPRVVIWKRGLEGLPDIRWAAGGQSGGGVERALQMTYLLAAAIEEMQELRP